MDPVFEEEQRHLSETYEKLEQIERSLVETMTADQEEAQKAHEDILDDLTIDLNNDVNLETYVELEALHQIIDSYNAFVRDFQLVGLLLSWCFFFLVLLFLRFGSLSIRVNLLNVFQ